MTEKTKLVLDILERTVATWVAAFLALFLASGVFTQTEPGSLILVLSAAQRAAMAAIPAALTFLKSALSSLFGNRNSAAALPASVD